MKMQVKLYLALGKETGTDSMEGYGSLCCAWNPLKAALLRAQALRQNVVNYLYLLSPPSGPKWGKLRASAFLMRSP